MKRSELKRKTALKPGKPLKRVAMKSGNAQLARKAPTPRKPASDAAAARRFEKVVKERGRCEACPRLAAGEIAKPNESVWSATLSIVRRCSGRAERAHHITPRGMGGHGDHDPDRNGLACCAASHDFIHAQPEFAYALGLLRGQR